MKRHALLSIIVAAVCLHTGFAKTPAELKDAFTTVLPTGMKARMCWVQDKTLYVVDSDDGNVRRLVTANVNADWPNVTADGSKVFFADLRDYTVKVVNWNGTGLTTLNADIPTNEITVEHWVDAAGVDWVIAGGGDCGIIRRFKLSSPSTCVTLWNKSGYPIPSHGDGLGLSKDGTRLCAMWEHDEGAGSHFTSGVQTVPAGGGAGDGYVITWIGCGITMIPDNSYTAAIGNGDIRVVDGAGNIKVKYDVNKAVTDWEIANGGQNTCHQYVQFRNMRWSNHVDLLAFASFNTKRNPWVYNVKTGKFIGVVDGLNCAVVEHPDLMVYAGTATVNAPRATRENTAAGLSARASVYSLDGRRLAPASLARSGAMNAVVLVRQGENAQLTTALTAK